MRIRWLRTANTNLDAAIEYIAREDPDVARKIYAHIRYLFPSVRSAERPMSEATVNGAIRRMGYEKHQMCAHGFRGMASSILNEKGFNRDWIERQLAHAPLDKVRAAYLHTEFLEGRTAMMTWWADYLDELKGGVVAAG